MSIGEMKDILTLQQPNRTPDGGGGFETLWSDVAEVYARIEELTGSESLRHAKLEGDMPCRITLHYCTDMTPAMRFTGGGRIYDIVSITDPDGKKPLWKSSLM